VLLVLEAVMPGRNVLLYENALKILINRAGSRSYRCDVCKTARKFTLGFLQRDEPSKKNKMLKAGRSVVTTRTNVMS
jgi:hypothetical protein